MIKRLLQSSTWTRHLLLLAAAVFCVSFGQGLFRGASTNFFVDTLGLSSKHVLWLAGIREIPGLGLMFIAAVFMHLPIAKRTAVSALIMGLGYALYATVGSYPGLIAVALIGSLGFHNWMPYQRALALNLTDKSSSGAVLGKLSSVRAFAGIAGILVLALVSRIASTMSLRVYYLAGGAMVAAAALLVFRIVPRTESVGTIQPRMLLKRRYWLYYVLTFFEGSRTQVFGTFGTLVLVQFYDLEVWQISLVLLASSVVNFVCTPYLGRLLDRYGERGTLSVSYVALAACFVGYALFTSPWLLGMCLVGINLLVTMSMGLTTYVNRIAPSEELTPTLSAGVSINHITSVTMSLLAGSLLELVGYQSLCWGAAAIIMLSVPFALAIRVRAPVRPIAGAAPAR